ncbi:MAG TPA: N-acetyltransferase [Acidobacteriaceae bacterium]|nr:N-acetyltransferase [Acidobacteriaceae bacterium]
MFAGEVTLRQYRPEDLPLMYAVEKLCFAPPLTFSREQLRELTTGESSFTSIAEDGGKLAGFAIAALMKERALRYGYLQTIDVAPEHRGRRIGSKLLRHVEENIAAAGGRVMLLHVAVQNREGIRLYEKHGYSRVGVEDGFYRRDNGDAFIYEKRLPSIP